MSGHTVRLACLVTAGIALTLVSTGAALARFSASVEVRTTEVAPNVYVLSAPRANAMVVIDDAGCFYSGPQASALVGAARTLAGQFGREFRWAVMIEDEDAPTQRDGGWGGGPAVTITHENLYRRMMRAHQPDRTTALPLLSFSHVLQVWLKAEEIHLIHDYSGYSDSDSVVHVEKAGVLYTGNLFTSDGYPAVRLDRGGSISQLIAFARYFIRNFHAAAHLVEPIVPGRGPLATVGDLQDYSAMLVAVHESVGELVARSFPLERILAIAPTRPFDARWGRGPVSPAAFTVQVYESYKKDLQRNAANAKERHEHGGASGGAPAAR